MVAADVKPTLHRIRLTVFWHQTLLAPGDGAKPEVFDSPSYRCCFASDDGSCGGLAIPWPRNTEQHFWERYLGALKALPSVRGRRAERALVPLRVEAPVDASVDGADAGVGTEGFLHPWGVTFAATVNLSSESLDFAAAADRLHELRRKPHFRLAGRPGPVGLDEVASEGLTAMRGLAMGGAEGRRYDAFSVCSLLAAKGDRSAFDPGTDPVNRFLHAATSFGDLWRKEQPLPVAEGKVAGLSKGPTNHLVYGVKRGRAIWSPERFLPAPNRPPTRTLTCHHRNLALLSMQTEALARFACETADRHAAGTTLHSSHESLSLRAVKILGSLHDGSMDTYRSGSAPAQIEQNGWLGKIDAIRKLHGLPAIAGAGTAEQAGAAEEASA